MGQAPGEVFVQVGDGLQLLAPDLSGAPCIP
jgi:hypothetical protein